MGHDVSGEESQGDVAVAEGDSRPAEPPKWAVILHNDNYTTVEFVVEVLKRYFQKNEEEAMRVTMEVHHNGKGVAGVYSYEIAETKVVQVTDAARGKGFPLKATAEEVRP